MKNVLVEQNENGEWVPVNGRYSYTRTETTRTVTFDYKDGRSVSEEQPCDPYTVEDEIDADKLLALYNQGIATDDDLTKAGLKVVVMTDPSPGKRVIADKFTADPKTGDVIYSPELEDIPTPPKSVQAPLQDRLADFFSMGSITPQELADALAPLINNPMTGKPTIR